MKTKLAHHSASRLALQGAGLRRQQVTRISIKGIMDVRTAEMKNTHSGVRTVRKCAGAWSPPAQQYQPTPSRSLSLRTTNSELAYPEHTHARSPQSSRIRSSLGNDNYHNAAPLARSLSITPLASEGKRDLEH
ncbi:hypothetical protein QQF64_017514 [Cirrhinus molitorella]|uniref:Uncharacterized protein n=1 Tax=Cirrhinus molitorella TaxID=172907 RepID=A0ABR3LLB8_9TELE